MKRLKLKENINHSVAAWPFMMGGNKWDLNTTCKVAKGLGAKSVELVVAEDFEIVRKHELTCAIALPPPIVEGEPPFLRGFNDPKYHGQLFESVGENMKVCREFRVPSTLVFTGYKWRDPKDPTSEVITTERGVQNCVNGLRQIAGLAEEYKVVACLEHLNTRDKTHPMKGHEGYWGDNMDAIAEIVRRVNSPWVKILFDVYHVQIMHGDVIRRLRQYARLIGHVHTAGCPGRGELDENQEINYPAVMRALVKARYRRFVGHEFIPSKGANPVNGLAQAIAVCDV